MSPSLLNLVRPIDILPTIKIDGSTNSLSHFSISPTHMFAWENIWVPKSKQIYCNFCYSSIWQMFSHNSFFYLLVTMLNACNTHVKMVRCGDGGCITIHRSGVYINWSSLRNYFFHVLLYNAKNVNRRLMFIYMDI